MARLSALFLAFLAGAASAAEGEWHLHWVRALPPRRPAWAHTPRVIKDTAYEPVVSQGIVLVGCCHNDALLALDLKTGGERWRFYANGPIRFAPVADGQRIYVGSDDGHVYCLDAARGTLRWTFRGGPSPRKVIGHERVISAWPISARPTLADGKLFVVAGHWPLDGIFVSALDAGAGRPLWHNDAAQFRPHRFMRVVGDRLFVYGFGGSGAFDVASGAAVKEKLPPLDLPAAPPAPPGVEGEVAGTFLEGGRLFVSTKEGLLYCFGPDKVAARTIPRRIVLQEERQDELPPVAEGYVLVLGLRDGRMVEALLRRPRVQVVAVDPDPGTVGRLRARFDAHGLFDDYRLAVHVGDPETFGLPPHIASLIVSETRLKPTEAILRLLRPYGGLCAMGGREIRRDGPLEGAADWTHEFADEGNSLCVHDHVLKPPLGLQWYEGPAGDLSLFYDGATAHDAGDAVTPLPPGAIYVEGRMILQGPGVLAAFDVYTGRELWRSPLPRTYVFHGVGIHSQAKALEAWKHPPALEMEVPPMHRSRATGFNYVAAPDGIYVAAGGRCLRFHPADGRLLSEWRVPLPGKLCWGNLRVAGHRLVATAFRPEDLVDAKAGVDGSGGEWAKDRMPMAHLLALDRHTGRLLWHREPTWGFLNRGLAMGGGKVFGVDLLFPKVLEGFQQAGRTLPAAPPSLQAFHLDTGQVAWSRPTDVLVRHLTYARERDLLLAPARTMVTWQKGSWTEVDKRRGRMLALRGADGKLLWEVAESQYFEPHIVHHDVVIDRYGWTFDLATGQRHLRPSPLTGQDEPWQIRRGGCNHLVASEHVVTWRVAFHDLATGAAMPLRAMESGCTPSLVVSGGVLCNPNYGTRLKRARMTSLAMVHQPENELWTSWRLETPSSPVPLRKAGFNFGAPGDRLSADGTLWLNVTPQEPMGLGLRPEAVTWFCTHSSRSDSWITASGVIGATEVELPTQLFRGKSAPRASPAAYTVRLHFAEPGDAGPGERVFGVWLQGSEALKALDIARERAQPRASLVREFKGIVTEGVLRITLAPSGRKPTVLCGVEIEREP